MPEPVPQSLVSPADEQQFRVDRVMAFLHTGANQRDIARATGWSRSSIQRYIKKGQRQPARHAALRASQSEPLDGLPATLLSTPSHAPARPAGRHNATVYGSRGGSARPLLDPSTHPSPQDDAGCCLQCQGWTFTLQNGRCELCRNGPPA